MIFHLAGPQGHTKLKNSVRATFTQASEQLSAEEQKQTQLSYMSVQARGGALQHSAQLDQMAKIRQKLDFLNP